ncbi:troponin T, skeletal muscle-like [Hyla sarda]|uniref:troponin T, skeletal muscle-like n=1 Tax=Hyla sarda TaxID=327740 RepID=UPI0024C32796|nr:troponin T, skeletal muscle-like [Hyla sarda]
MMGSNFSPSEEKLLICRFLQRGYDSTRSQTDKQRIVSSLRKKLLKVHGRSHEKMAIVKKWSDLKRWNMAQVRHLGEKFHPGAPQPSVRPKRTMRQAEEEEKEEEMMEEEAQEQEEEAQEHEEEAQEQEEEAQEEEEQPGPSHGGQNHSPPPPQDEEEWDSSTSSVAYTPIQEIVQQINKKIKLMKREHKEDICDIHCKIRVMEQKLERRIAEIENLLNKLG